MSSVMLKCREPTYNLIGPVLLIGAIRPGAALIADLFFSACDAYNLKQMR